MIRSWRFIPVLAVALVLSACAREGSVVTALSGDTFYGAGCLSGGSKIAAAADWSKAKTIDVRIRQGEFSRVFLELKQNKPYILKLSNGDDSTRMFQAQKFFRTVALNKITIDGKSFKETCFSAINIPPLKVAEVSFIPTRDGDYSFDDYFLMMPAFPSLGLDGTITVE